MAAATGAPADGAGPVRVISGDRSAGGLVIARTTPPQAIAKLGKPGVQRPEPPYSCVLSWKAIGLTLNFIDLNGKHACKTGALIVATITNRPHWQTARGLHVGDPAARVRALYPVAGLHTPGGGQSGYWLITRHACKEVGGQAFPGLLARLKNGHVAALVLSASVCE